MRVSLKAEHVVAETKPLSPDLIEQLNHFFEDEPLALNWDTLNACRAPTLERCIAAVTRFHQEKQFMSPKINLVKKCLQNHVLFSADEADVAAGKDHGLFPPDINYDISRGTLVRIPIKQLIMSLCKELDDSLCLHDCPIGTLLACSRSLSLNLQNKADDPHPVLVAQMQRVVDAFPVVVETHPEFVLKCMNLFLERELSIPIVKLDSWKGFVTTHKKKLKDNDCTALKKWLKKQNQSRTSAAFSRASQSAKNVMQYLPSPTVSKRNQTGSGSEKTSPRSPRFSPKVSPKLSPRAGRANLTSSAPNPLRKSMSDDE
jgi:hypothetical protein